MMKRRDSWRKRCQTLRTVTWNAKNSYVCEVITLPEAKAIKSRKKVKSDLLLCFKMKIAVLFSKSKINTWYKKLQKKHKKGGNAP